MSNCIEIKKSEVVFTPEEFDIEKFLKDKEFHMSLEHNKEYSLRNGGYSFPLNCTFCWFLRNNSSVDEKGNLHIRFGKGESSHTQRDFSYTIRFLIENYIKTGVKPKKHMFHIYDEYDSFESVEYRTIEFSKEWQTKQDEEDKILTEKIKKQVHDLFESGKIKIVERKV